MGRIISTSPLSRVREPYECQHPWPEDCFVQCGSSGIVFTDEKGLQKAFTNPLETVVTALAPEAVAQASPLKHYRTAFFEAFPKQPDTFIRGEGADIAAAEAEAWQKFQKATSCPGHEFEARGYENGAGFCRHCNMFASNVIPPHLPCFNCGKLAWGERDKFGEMWCGDCWETMPEERMDEYQIKLRQAIALIKEEDELDLI